jgi:hypothetical protein
MRGSDFVTAFFPALPLPLTGVRPDMRRFLECAEPTEASAGERDRVRALLSREESELESEPSFSSDMESGDL